MNLLVHKYKAFNKDHPDSNKIFVIGCGRSGTHWLGYILASHPKIHVTVEKQRIFNKVTAMALNASEKKRLVKPHIKWYRLEHAQVAPCHYADKSHPNIWLVDELASVFPNAFFIGIQREPYGTVSSMLKHKGVREWCERWKEFPVPNPFLGITNENVDNYKKMSLAGRCAMRWLSHREQIKQVKCKYPERIHVLEYEALFDKT